MSSPPGAPGGVSSSAPDRRKGEGTPGVTKTPLMLRAAKDFAALQHSDRSRSDRLLVARFVSNGLDRTRFGISTGRRVGGAVVRNRIRRRVREGLRALVPRFVPGWDVLLVVRPASSTASQAELAQALERLLHKGGALQGEGIPR